MCVDVHASKVITILEAVERKKQMSESQLYVNIRYDMFVLKKYISSSAHLTIYKVKMRLAWSGANCHTSHIKT